MLSGAKITLRVLKSNDLDKYINCWTSLSARGHYFPQVVFNEVYWKKRFAENGLWGDDSGHMAIVNVNDEIIGAIFFFKPQLFFSYLEIGYIIFSEDERGKGHTTEAVKLFCKYLFDTKPINKLVLNINPDNVASKSVAQKCLFRSEGIDRGATFSHGEYCDIERFGILRNEFYRK